MVSPEFLTNRFAVLALELAGNEPLLDAQRDVIAAVVLNYIQDDLRSSFVKEGCEHLFRSRLFYNLEDHSTKVVKEIISRFTYSENHRSLIESVETWYDDLLLTFIKHSDAFLSVCGEEAPEDVILLFEAVRELANRNPVKIPDSFTEITLEVLQGNIFADWQLSDSALGRNFRSQVGLLIDQYGNVFNELVEQAPDLLVSDYEDEEI